MYKKKLKPKNHNQSFISDNNVSDLNDLGFGNVSNNLNELQKNANNSPKSNSLNSIQLKANKSKSSVFQLNSFAASMAARRKAINGDDELESPTPKSKPGKLSDNSKLSAVSSQLENQLSISKNQAQIKKRDQFDKFSTEQSQYADSFKPGKENTKMSRFKKFTNSIGRGIGNMKQKAKNSWLGRKLGFSGLNKNERDAANSRAVGIKRGEKHIDQHNKEGAKQSGRATAVGGLTTVAAAVGGKVPQYGKLIKAGITSAGAAGQSHLQAKAAAGYNADKGDTLTNIGSQAKGAGFTVASKQNKMKAQRAAVGAAGAAVDTLNPTNMIQQYASEIGGDQVSLPSAQSLAEQGFDSVNKKKKKELENQADNVTTNQANAYERQNTGGINREEFSRHQAKNGGLLKELGTKFDSGKTLKSRVGLSDAEPKIKEGVLKKVSGTQKFTPRGSKKNNLGAFANSPMLKNLKNYKPEQSSADDDDWD